MLVSGETIDIQFISGEIRDGEAIIRGPSGVGWTCDDISCCEPMPGEQRHALIGDKNAIEVRAGGELQLRINDCDSGLFDNSGKLTVKISP